MYNIVIEIKEGLSLDALVKEIERLYVTEDKNMSNIAEELQLTLFKIKSIVDKHNLKNKKEDYIKSNFKNMLIQCNGYTDKLSECMKITEEKVISMVEFYGFKDYIKYKRPKETSLQNIEENLLQKLSIEFNLSNQYIGFLISKNEIYVDEILNNCDIENFKKYINSKEYKDKHSKLNKILKLDLKCNSTIEDIERVIFWFLYVENGLLLSEIGSILNCSRKIAKDKLDRYNIPTIFENFILDMNEHFKVSSRQLAKNLNVPWFRVKQILKKYGCEGKYSKTYVEPNIQEKIIKLYQKEKMSINQISKKLNIGYKIVRRVLVDNDISIDYFWNEEKDSYIIEELGNLPIKKICKLTGKTISAINNRAYALKVYSPLNATSYFLVSDITKSLNISKFLVYYHLKTGKLKASKVKITENRSFYLLSSRNIWSWLKNNKHLIDIASLPYNEFGMEPEWVKEMRKNHKK